MFLNDGEEFFIAPWDAATSDNTTGDSASGHPHLITRRRSSSSEKAARWPWAGGKCGVRGKLCDKEKLIC